MLGLIEGPTCIVYDMVNPILFVTRIAPNPRVYALVCNLNGSKKLA